MLQIGPVMRDQPCFRILTIQTTFGRAPVAVADYLILIIEYDQQVCRNIVCSAAIRAAFFMPFELQSRFFIINLALARPWNCFLNFTFLLSFYKFYISVVTTTLYLFEILYLCIIFVKQFLISNCTKIQPQQIINHRLTAQYSSIII